MSTRSTTARRFYLTLEDALWSRVDRSAGPDQCWPFTGNTGTGAKPGRPGYGGLTCRGVHWTSHRAAWTLAHGPIPDGMWVLHRCDNPPCCNPAHLFLGTVKDNVRDMHAKGRWASPVRVPDEGRVCLFCGRSTMASHSKLPRECGACARKALRNGRCGDCRAPLSTWRGQPRPHVCGEPIQLISTAGRPRRPQRPEAN